MTEKHYLSEKPDLTDKDIRKILDKSFELAFPLAATDSLYDMKERIDSGEAKKFHFDSNSKTFAFFDEDNQKREVKSHKVVESGVAVCKSKKTGEVYFKDLRMVGGLSMEVDTYCDGDPTEFVGSIHTHPGGLTSPSDADLRTGALMGEKISCIATRYEDDNGHRNFRVSCLLNNTPNPLDSVDEYARQIQDIFAKPRYKDKLFKLSTVQKGGILGMRGEVLMPSTRTVREGNTIKVVQDGTVPFFNEIDARSFDTEVEPKLQEMADERIVQERKYDSKGNYVITLSEGVY